MKIFKDNGNPCNYILVCFSLEREQLIEYLQLLEKGVKCEAPLDGLDSLHLEKCKIKSVYDMDAYKPYLFDNFKYYVFLLEGSNVRGQIMYRWSNLPDNIGEILYYFDEIYTSKK